MSKEASWFALAVDWSSSPIFRGLGGPERLAWIAVLTTIKRDGRAGLGTIRPDLLASEYGFEVAACRRVLEAAVRDGAATLGLWTDTSVCVELLNWRAYQDRLRSGRPRWMRDKRNPDAENAVQCCTPAIPAQNSRTHHPSPITHHEDCDPYGSLGVPLADKGVPPTSGVGENSKQRTPEPKGRKPARAATTPAVGLDRETGRWVGLDGQMPGSASRTIRQHLGDVAPGVMLDAELAKAAGWVLADYAKRRKVQYLRFLTNWVSRAQDDAARGRIAGNGFHANGQATPAGSGATGQTFPNGRRRT